MNSHLLQGIAAERTRELRYEAAAASQARAARSDRPSRRTGVVAPRGIGRLVRRTAHP
jgi:hypothetical protein